MEVWIDEKDDEERRFIKAASDNTGENSLRYLVDMCRNYPLSAGSSMRRKKAVLWAGIFGIVVIYFIRKGRKVRNGNFRSK